MCDRSLSLLYHRYAVQDPLTPLRTPSMLSSSSRRLSKSVPAAARLLSTKARPSISASHLVQTSSSSTRRLPSTAAAARSISASSSSRYANPSPAADAVAHSENPTLPSLHTFTEEEEMLRDTVRKFSEEMVAPRVREMDEAEKMDPEIIQGLFDNGVSGRVQSGISR